MVISKIEHLARKACKYHPNNTTGIRMALPILSLGGASDEFGKPT